MPADPIPTTTASSPRITLTIPFQRLVDAITLNTSALTLEIDRLLQRQGLCASLPPNVRNLIADGIRTTISTAILQLFAAESSAGEGKPARWHWFALKPAEMRPLFAFPGIYRQWKGPVRKDGPNVDLEVFSFMTTLPNTLTQTINHERSPVLLTEEEQFSTWLTGAPEQAFGLIKASDPARMEIVQSGFDKKDLLAAA